MADGNIRLVLLHSVCVSILGSRQWQSTTRFEQFVEELANICSLQLDIDDDDDSTQSVGRQVESAFRICPPLFGNRINDC